MNFLKFLQNEEPDIYGRLLIDIWKFKNKDIENIHDYIQFIFPLDKPSQSVFHNMYLKTNQEIYEIRTSKLAKSNIIKSARWFLLFLQKNSKWKNKYDHNHLRISRIIQCLRLLVYDNEADNFFNAILGLLDIDSLINKETLEFWKQS